MEQGTPNSDRPLPFARIVGLTVADRRWLAAHLALAEFRLPGQPAGRYYLPCGHQMGGPFDTGPRTCDTCLEHIADRERQLATPPSMEGPPIAMDIPDRATMLGWHPPGHRGTDSDTRYDYTSTTYRFAPFTGTEPEPTVPAWANEAYGHAYGGTPPRDSSEWDRELLDALRRIHGEVDAATVLWRTARYERTVTEALRAAMPAWQSYRRARTGAEAAYTALDDTPDSQWRSALLRLTRARAEALDAAVKLDDATYPIAEAWNGEHERVLEQARSAADLATAVGLDILDITDQLDYLHVDSYRDYGGLQCSPTREKLERRYAEQDRHIAEVTRLAGQPES